MEDGLKRWGFGANEVLDETASHSIRGLIEIITSHINEDDSRPIIPFGSGDPSAYPSFRTNPVAEKAVSDAVRSAKFNSYAPARGLLVANRAIAEYLSRDLSYQISPNDIYPTAGCSKAIEVITSVLARPNANILLSRPIYPMYEARAAFSKLKVRHFDLLPEKGWEVDLDAVEALADNNTAAMVIINPSNPCGSVFTYQHLKKIAETARKLGILVISDEVYAHLAFGSIPFVSMAEFGSIVPVITVGGISKRWFVPGWRLGWIAVHDPDNIMKNSGLVRSLTNYLNISSPPVTFIQGAIPCILEQTEEDFFAEKLDLVRKCAETCYEVIKGIRCITCSQKPEGSMFMMVKLNLSLLEDISDDMDFCCKLAKEDSVIVIPGRAFGLQNWLRITFTVELEALEEGLGRIKNFCQRHAKKP